MGLPVLEIEVGHPVPPDDIRPVEFHIDSGAVYAAVPTPLLEEPAIQPLAEESFRLPDGSKITRKKGVAVFRYHGKVGGADVTVGEEENSCLVETLAVEVLGLALDPLKRELKPLPTIPGERKRSS